MGGTSQVNLNRFFCLQKRACNLILDYNIVNVVESMEDLKILTVYDRLYLRKAKFMHKVSLGECPSYISELFQELCLMKTFLHSDHHQVIHLLPQGRTKKSLSKA